MTTRPTKRLLDWRRLSVAFLLLALAWFIAWVAAMQLIVTEPLPRADAVVVLSGSRNMSERVAVAAQLFHDARTPLVLLTNDDQRGGWVSREQRNPFFFEGAVQELQQRGVPKASIVVLSQPVNSTRDEAILLRKYAEEHQINSLVIVTSPYHTRRALYIFRDAFDHSGRQLGVISLAPGWQSPRPSCWWLYPGGWRMVAGEYLKLAYSVVS